MLWTAVFMPELSLQIAVRSRLNVGPLVISTGADNRPIVFEHNVPAHDAGIRAGMTIAAARALTNELNVVPRDLVGEKEAVHNLACWACQFTPVVVLKDDEGLLLEVASTLTLHHGLSMFLGKLRRGIRELGYSVSIGVAPTPMAAWLFGKARFHGYEIRMCKTQIEIEERIVDLPLALLDWPHDVLNTLSSLGIVRFTECLALPSEGFAKRFGADRWYDLQRILGRLPDPRQHFIAPESYRARTDFGFEVNDALALLFPLKRLLSEMEGYLRGRGVGILEYVLSLEHANRTKTAIRIGVAKVERKADRLVSLTREHLTRLDLPDAVLALSIQVERVHLYEEVSESWLPDQTRDADSWFQLLNKLAARLGPENVYQLQSIDDYRPEQSWRSFPAITPMKPNRPSVTGALRPMFLLRSPRKLVVENDRPLCHGAIDLLSGPERIETGWWDGKPACRDYYVGRNVVGETMWLYRNHSDLTSWFLHGYFA